MKLHLLGTGTPILDRRRPATTSFLIEVGRQKALIDAGRGVTMQLLKQGLSPVDIDVVFITHHHYDHICDLGEVMMAAWKNGRREPVHIFGPTGITEVVDALLDQVFARDIYFTMSSEPEILDIRNLFRVTGISGTWHKGFNNWQISAEKVDHGSNLGLSEKKWLCLGYRIKSNRDGQSLVIGGDTIPCKGLNRLAKAANTLVLSCYLSKEEVSRLGAEYLTEHIIMSSGQVGKVACEAGVDRLVLTHFRRKSPGTMEKLVQEVKADFTGELHIGQDLMVLDI